MQSVASLIADPGEVSSIPARPDTFVKIYHEYFSVVNNSGILFRVRI